MRISSLFYLTRQGWKNMVNNRMMTVASIGILTACLFITGAAALLGLNVNSFAGYLAGQNEIVVYLHDTVGSQNVAPVPDANDPAGVAPPAEGEGAAEGEASAEGAAPAEGDPTTEGQTGTEGEGAAAEGEPAVPAPPAFDIEAAVAVLESIDNVESYTYVSKDEALTEAIGWMGDYADLLEGYRDDNPMPASFRVTVKDLNLLEETVAQLGTIQGVEYISSPNSMAQILVSIKTAVNWLALGLVAVLGLVCVVVIGNTIRLTVFARRREINIMKYVGATNAFIRWPFFVEGMTSGLLAGLLAFGLLSLGYTQLLQLLAEGTGFAWLNNLFFSLISYESVRAPMLIVFLAAGALLGSMGTAGSVRKYLRV